MLYLKYGHIPVYYILYYISIALTRFKSSAAQSCNKKQSFERTRLSNQPINCFKQLLRPERTNDASRRTTLFLMLTLVLFLLPRSLSFPCLSHAQDRSVYCRARLQKYCVDLEAFKLNLSVLCSL